jgi:T-complex protein 1 subunit zeta
MDRETLIDVARTSLRTKVHAELADVLTEAVVDSILAIKKKMNLLTCSWLRSWK